MSTQIKFGTSGWRAIVAEEFTVANVRRAVTGIARYIKTKSTNGGRIVVGRDPRYMGERFVEIAAEVLTGFGLRLLSFLKLHPHPRSPMNWSASKPMAPSISLHRTILRNTTGSSFPPGWSARAP